MAQARLTYLPDLLDEHLDQAAFLWVQREAALHASSRYPYHLQDLDRRIDAHVEGLIVNPDAAVSFLTPALGGDPALSFVAGLALLRLGTPDALRAMTGALEQAVPETVDALGEALCHGPATPLLDTLRKMAAGASLAAQAAALDGLSVHSPGDVKLERVQALLGDAAPQARALGWRIVRNAQASPAPSAFEAGLADESPLARKEATLSAAWCNARWFTEHTRSAPLEAKAEGLGLASWFAVLAGPSELERVRTWLRRAELGPARFQLAERYGHPLLIDDLLLAVQDPDARTAIAAADALSCLTGVDLESKQRVQLPPEDGHKPDEFEKEFLEEAKLPDIPKAREAAAAAKAKFGSATRIRQGLDVAGALAPEQRDRLDLRGRAECHLRARAAGRWSGSAFDLERFPSSSRPLPLLT